MCCVHWYIPLRCVHIQILLRQIRWDYWFPFWQKCQHSQHLVFHHRYVCCSQWFSIDSSKIELRFMDTLSIAPAKVCSKSKSSGDGVSLDKTTDIHLSFIHCIYMYNFICIHVCKHIIFFLHNLCWFCFTFENKIIASKPTITYHNHQTCLTLGYNSRGSNKPLGTTVPL